MPRKFHEYTNLEYWQDYVQGHQYICPNYRFERLMQEVEEIKSDLEKAREWIEKIALNGNAHLSDSLRTSAIKVLQETNGDSHESEKTIET